MRLVYALAGLVVGAAIAYVFVTFVGTKNYVPPPPQNLIAVTTSEVIVESKVESYVPASGGTVNWQTLDIPAAPFQVSWFGPQPCSPATSSGTSVACNVAPTGAMNNTYGYAIGAVGQAPPPTMHVMRVGTCNNCTAVVPGFGNASAAYNGVYCSNNAPAVLPLNIPIVKSGTVIWTVLGGNNPQAVITFTKQNPCAQVGSSLTGNKPVCKVSANPGVGSFRYTVTLANCPGTPPAPYTLFLP